MKKINFCTAILIAAGMQAASAGGIKSIQLPPDGMQLAPSTLPGYLKTQQNCVACHSAEYMQYAPATAGKPYWEAMVKRMKTVFKAPVDDADMPVIVEYLSKTYGSALVTAQLTSLATK